MTPEVEKTANIFQVLLEKAKLRKGKEVEIVTFAHDSASGFNRIYSQLGTKGEEKLNRALTEFVQELVPEGESRETLEAGFENNPDRIKRRSHHDEITSEWHTVVDSLILGIKAVRDQRGENVRTWYLKGV